MARRRLEAAIQAGKAIEQGQELAVRCKHVERQYVIGYEEERDGVYSLQFSYDGNQLVVGYADGTIQTINTSNTESQAMLRYGKRDTTGVTVLRFNPRSHDQVFAGTADGIVYVCDITNPSCRELLTEPKNEINCLDFSQDGDTFATAGKDLNIRLYDTQTLQNKATFDGYHFTQMADDMTGHAQRVFALKYHPDQNSVLVTAGWDNTLRIWDSRTNAGLQRIIAGPHISADGLDIKGSQILTASWVYSDALQLWDFGNSSLVQNIKFTDNIDVGAYLYCCQFCSNDVVAAGGSGSNSVRLINVNTSKMLCEISLDNKSVFCLDTTQGGRQVAVAGAGQTLLLSVLS